MNRTVPELLSRSDKAYYADLFQAIDRQDWSRVDAMLAERDDGPLHHVARAEYYLAATSPGWSCRRSRPGWPGAAACPTRNRWAAWA